MSIIKCNECSREVSSNANMCPHCGNPINGEGRLIMIQKTKKKWKLGIIVAWILLFLGLSTLTKNTTTGIGIISVSIIVWFSAKFGSWWTNG